MKPEDQNIATQASDGKPEQQIRVRRLLKSVGTWAGNEVGVAGILLVGSQARGDAHPSSDVDLVILCADPAKYLRETTWIKFFGEPSNLVREEWGDVTSLRVHYQDDLEVEYGMTNLDWASLDPRSSGTEEVIRNGAQIVWDPLNLLRDLLKASGMNQSHFDVGSFPVIDTTPPTP